MGKIDLNICNIGVVLKIMTFSMVRKEEFLVLSAVSSHSLLHPWTCGLQQHNTVQPEFCWASCLCLCAAAVFSHWEHPACSSRRPVWAGSGQRGCWGHRGRGSHCPTHRAPAQPQRRSWYVNNTFTYCSHSHTGYSWTPLMFRVSPTGKCLVMFV